VYGSGIAIEESSDYVARKVWFDADAECVRTGFADSIVRSIACRAVGYAPRRAELFGFYDFAPCPARDDDHYFRQCPCAGFGAFVCTMSNQADVKRTVP